jgi:hypothetical protein
MSASTTPYQPYADRYIDGPASGPTAIDIINDLGLIGKLQDKVILTTGGSAGLGQDTARALHITGAKLYLTFRDKARGQAVAEDLQSRNPDGQKHVLIEMELANLESVKMRPRSSLLKRSAWISSSITLVSWPYQKAAPSMVSRCTSEPITLDTFYSSIFSNPHYSPAEPSTLQVA